MHLFLTSFMFGVLFAITNGEGNEPESADWESYKAFHKKMFANDARENVAKATFTKNAKKIAAHNKAFDEGKVSYKKELNKFSDMDASTFEATYCGYKPSSGSRNFSSFSSIGQLAADVDWKAQGMVTPIKNQGRCGSCWAFTAVGALESQVLIQGQEQQILSEQQLVDCDSSNGGCNGGHQMKAWRYIQQSGGITASSSYPYKGSKGSCRFNGDGAVKVADYGRVSERSVDGIRAALAAKGPLAIAVDGRQFQSYSRGILACSSPNLSHAVLLVGSGSEGGKDYWLIKNSWGTNWGSGGYVKVSRKPGQDCGVSKDVSYVSIE